MTTTAMAATTMTKIAAVTIIMTVAMATTMATAATTVMMTEAMATTMMTTVKCRQYCYNGNSNSSNDYD